jgi:hypothetical protein
MKYIKFTFLLSVLFCTGCATKYPTAQSVAKEQASEAAKYQTSLRTSMDEAGAQNMGSYGEGARPLTGFHPSRGYPSIQSPGMD